MIDKAMDVFWRNARAFHTKLSLRPAKRLTTTMRGEYRCAGVFSLWYDEDNINQMFHTLEEDRNGQRDETNESHEFTNDTDWLETKEQVR